MLHWEERIMKRALASITASAAVMLLALGGSGASERRRAVVDHSGAVVKTLVDERRTEAHRAPGPCAAAAGAAVRQRESHTPAGTVDACGRLRPAGNGAPPLRAPVSPAGLTIDRMTTRGWFSEVYTPGGTIGMLQSADTYHLSDGSSWHSGAGSLYLYTASLRWVEIKGHTIRYHLSPPSSGLLYQQTDFDAGDHSAQGTLGVAGPLVLEAAVGSTTATLTGRALVVANDATWYGEPRFNYYSAVVGSVVRFRQTFTLQGGAAWAPDTFSRPFSYSQVGEVDFAHPVSVPRVVGLGIVGPPRVPDESQVQFAAEVLFENGVRRSVTTAAGWEVAPAGLATVEAGLLTTGALTTPQEALTLRASYESGNQVFSAEKVVLCLAEAAVESPDAWPMYQADARHTGYLPLSLDPASFALRWQRTVDQRGFALNPVAAGEGRVFVTLQTYFEDVVSLFALDAADGRTLWSKGFGQVFSVNPPSHGYGAVYVQTGNHGQDTWLRAYDAANGEPIFQSPHAAQWERYLAPTLHDGRAYVNGGSYGGMYAFGAIAGGQSWFLELPQYDQWTPAVAGDFAFAYVGEYEPGLYVANRHSGALEYVILDPEFEWDGWSMHLAPVIGAHDDVLAVHDGRLISFDTVLRSIRWQRQGGFLGQPSVSGGRIYVVASGRLAVLDELTGGELWSWQPPEGALQAPMIVTDSHLFASTAAHVYAVDLATRQQAWSYPAAGHLALADRTLYVAGGDGALTAITVAAPRAAVRARPAPARPR
jgi:outer membrane protein assembly factor BamB